MNSQQLYLDVRICNYKGEPVRLFSQYDLRNNVLILSGILSFKPVVNHNLTDEEIVKKEAIKRNTLLVVDNAMAFGDYDLLFNEREHLDYAAQAYFDYDKQGVLAMPDEIKGRTNMGNIVQLKKMELNKGSTWELNTASVQNIHIAVLALCYAAKKATGGVAVSRMIGDTEAKESYHSMMPYMV